MTSPPEKPAQSNVIGILSGRRIVRARGSARSIRWSCAARAEGRPFKLICRAQRTAAGLSASVRLEQIPADDPLASVRGTVTMLCLATDVLPGLIIAGTEPSPRTTAYGLLSDLLRIARDETGEAKVRFVPV